MVALYEQRLRSAPRTRELEDTVIVVQELTAKVKSLQEQGEKNAAQLAERSALVARVNELKISEEDL